MTGRNAAAYHLYLMIQAGAPMPDDAIVRRNCAVIQLVTDRVERQQFDVAGLLTTLFVAK
jgi:hypothetical protein